MKQMVPPLVALVLIAPAVSAAPAPDRAKEKLEKIKDKLLPYLRGPLQRNEEPFVMAPEMPDYKYERPDVKVARMISPTEAKITILIPAYRERKRVHDLDELLTLYLTYHEGVWTTTRYVATGTENEQKRKAVLFLMLQIDMLGEQ